MGGTPERAGHPQDTRAFRQRGSRVLDAELDASQQERLRRNECAPRLAEKPSKRDLQGSRHNLLELDGWYRLNSDG